MKHIQINHKDLRYAKKSREKKTGTDILFDGSDMLCGHQLRLPVFPMNYQGFIHLKGGCLGFLNHQQYWDVLLLLSKWVISYNFI